MRPTVIVLATALGVMMASPAALGSPAAAAVDSAEVVLVEAANGAGWTATVGITNLTTGPLKIVAKQKSKECKPKAGDDGTYELPAAQHQDVTVTVPAPCKAADGLSFVLTARGGGAAQPLPVAASVKKTTEVDWSSLRSFLWALLASLILVGGIWAAWLIRVWVKNVPVTGKRPLTSLAGLDASWSFKDSIVSNLTAASGLVAVVLGSSDFLKAALGPKAEAAIAVTAIAGAIALGLVGAAGVLVLALRKPSAKSVSILGLCAGSVVALGAAGGQVWTVTLLLVDLSIGGTARNFVIAACAAATVLLVIYAVVSITGFLDQGTKLDESDPLAPPANAELVAASVVAAAMSGSGVSRQKVLDLLAELLTKPSAEVTGQKESAEKDRATIASLSATPALPLQERSALP
jgi:hypothetical protein